MSEIIVRPSGPLQGRLSVPGDKSISHRALLLAALAEGVSRIENWLPSGDCLASLDCLRALGVQLEVRDASLDGRLPAAAVTVHGVGLNGLRAPAGALDCGRSGTTMRLLAGILAGQRFDSTLIGDPQLLRRPMRRIAEPLRRMGAEIQDQDGRGPLIIRGQRLAGYDHTLDVASAQVKSCLLLAGLFAGGSTTVRLPGPARDHTERMLESQLGPGTGALSYSDRECTLRPAQIDHLRPLDVVVPGDLSSAAFLLVAAALLPGSQVRIEGVGVNPTRSGLIEVLQEMGAGLAVSAHHLAGNEPVADLTVRGSGLRGARVAGERVVRMIDEFPALAVAATQAHGETVVRDAAELRVKETDRIATAVNELRTLGAEIEARADGFVVHGPAKLRGARVSSHGDHRLAMALVVAGLIAEGETVIAGADCIADSFPGFVAALGSLQPAGRSVVSRGADDDAVP